MVYNYTQPLWEFIEPDREDIYNGFAEAGLTSLGGLGSLFAGKLNQQFIEKWAIRIIVTISFCEGIFAHFAGITNSVIVSYVMLL